MTADHRSQHEPVDWAVISPATDTPNGQSIVTAAITVLLREHSDVVGYELPPPQRVAGFLRVAINLAVSIAKVRPNVYLSARSGKGWPLDFVLLLYTRLLGLKSFYHFHSRAAAEVPGRLRRFALRRLDSPTLTLIALCPSSADRARNAYGLRRSRIEFVDNYAYSTVTDGYSHARKSSGHTISAAVANVSPRTTGPRDVRLGFIGNLHPSKGPFEAIRLATTMQGAGVGCTLAIAGATADSDTAAAIRQACEQEHGISYIGAVYGQAKEEFYASIDWLLFPSTYQHEYAPMVIVESQSRGVPVIAVSVGCIAEMLLDPSFVVTLHDFIRPPEILIAQLARPRPHGKEELQRLATGRGAEARKHFSQVFGSFGPDRKSDASCESSST